MPKSHRPYAPEFRQRIIELVRKGRTPEELGRQFDVELSAHIHHAHQESRGTYGAPRIHAGSSPTVSSTAYHSDSRKRSSP